MICMKCFFFILFMLFPSVLFSQKEQLLEPAVLEVHYRHTMQQDTIRRNKMETDSMILRIGKNISQFLSYHTFYHDSLWNDHQGREKAEELTLEALRMRDHSKRPQIRTTYDYLYTNYPTGKITVTNRRFVIGYVYDDEYLPQQWTVKDSVKHILGHLCRMATCNFRGRNWVAWFAADIPVKSGPWKLSGLPGLILEAYDRNDDYHYTAVRIDKHNLRSVTFYNFEETAFLRTDRKRFLRSQRAFISGKPVNEIELIQEIMQKGLKSTYVQREQRRLFYDFKERDYQ